VVEHVPSMCETLESIPNLQNQNRIAKPCIQILSPLVTEIFGALPHAVWNINHAQYFKSYDAMHKHLSLSRGQLERF
jgi:hypothetical protein